MTKHMPETARRTQILAAAREEFIAHGYDETRVGDVAERAELSKGAVYFYFESKRDLFMALVLAEHEQTYAFLDGAERDTGPALFKLLRVGWEYLDYFANRTQPPRFFLMMTEAATRDPDIQSECEKLHRRFVDATSRILAQGVAEGAFRPMDTNAIAQMLKAMIDGFGGHAAINITPDQDGLATEGFRTLLKGILLDPNQADLFIDAALSARDMAKGAPLLRQG